MPSDLCVIHLDDGRQWRGGQFQVSLLVEGLARAGVRQVVLTPPESPLGTKLAAEGVDVRWIDFKGEWDWRSSRVVAALATKADADVLHAHTAHAHAIALRAAKRLRRLRRMDAPSFVITRRVDFPVAEGFFSRRKYHYAHQRFIAISEGVFQALVRGGVPAERIEIVPSGVPPIPSERALTREAGRLLFKIADNEIAIVSVGALTDHKGHRYLIEAAERVIREAPRARFWILGEGELRPELEDLALRLGVADHVRLPGHVADAREKLAGFDLYVSSSHLEGMGTSILDAMLAGLPVVAAAAGGVTDIVRPGLTGRLVPPRDPEALAAGILSEIATPDQPRRLAAQEARRFVEVNYSAERMVEGTLAVYRRLRAGGLSAEPPKP